MTTPNPTALRIEYVPLDDVIGADRNAKEHDVPAIQRAIRQFGFADPVLIDERTGRLVGGHGRLKALRRERDENKTAPSGIDPTDGWRVPVTRGWSSISDEHAEAANLALNRVHDLGGYDDRALAEILDDLFDTSPDYAEAAGYSQSDLDALLAGFDDDPLPDLDRDDESDEDDDDRPGISAEDLDEDLTDHPDNQTEAAPETARSRLGDVWLMGEHRLVVGDCTNAVMIGKALNHRKADLVIADPPYGMRLDTDYTHGRAATREGKFAGYGGNEYETVQGDHEDYDPRPLLDLLSGVKEQFWWGADYYAERLPNRNEGSWLVWDKRTPSQADGFGSEFETCWSRKKHKRRMLRHPWFGMLAASEDAKDAVARVHPTQKPVSLYAAILGAWAKPGALLLDPYGGSGTAVIAAERAGCVAAVIEIDPRYADVIVMRWQRVTGGQATRESDGVRFDDLDPEDAKPLHDAR